MARIQKINLRNPRHPRFRRKFVMAGRHHQHAFSRARVHDIFSVRSDSAPKDSSVSISDGRGGALHFLSALTLGIGVRRLQLVLPDRSRRIDGINHVVLSIFPRRGHTTLMVGAGLAGVYTFLYITLRQQDYALLMGAIALFIVLAVVMYGLVG